MKIVKHTASKQVNVTHAKMDTNFQKDFVKFHYRYKILLKIIIAKLSIIMFVRNAIMGTI